MNTASYSLEIKDEYRCFYNTNNIYQDAVSFLIKVVSAEYDEIKDVTSSKKRQSIIEKLVHSTKKEKLDIKHSIKSSLSFLPTLGEALSLQPLKLYLAINPLLLIGRLLTRDARGLN